MPRPAVPMLAALVALVSSASLPAASGQSAQESANWTTAFDIEPGELVSTGRNPFFVLEPGYQLTLEDGKTRLVITVLHETRTVAGVDTRIVEERETENGVPAEVSRNLFAISTRTNSVFYFGEEVDVYTDGKIANHEGAWQAGANGATFGLMMPGVPLLKARYFQEIAPKVAMDRAEIVSLSVAMKTPAGAFTNVLKIDETSPLEPIVKESKYYARGIGLIQDGSLKLVKYGPRAQASSDASLVTRPEASPPDRPVTPGAPASTWRRQRRP